MRIGVYVCHCGSNIADTIKVAEVAEFARTLPNVVVSRDYLYLCSDPGLELIRNDIAKFKLDRIVLAACSPAMHRLTFMNETERAGLNPYCLDRANIREQCSWVHMDKDMATEKAKQLVAAAIARVTLAEPLQATEAGVKPSVLVIGGGIAGIQSAIELGNMGFAVFLVEKEPHLGGHMAQLHQTFPDLSNAGEMLKSRLEKLNSNPKIEVLPYSEVIEVGGYVGNFQARVKRKPRYVDMEKCTRCGLCLQACPVSVPDEFESNLSQRRAIYSSRSPEPYYLIDPGACLKLQGKSCSACEEACQPEAIDFNQQAEERELETGAIVMATGYEVFDCHLKPEYGCGVYENVITGLQLERLVSPTGPTGGKLQIKGRKPKNVVFIQCVGSRDKCAGHEYCSQVCCMSTAKQAHYVKKNNPGAEVTVCYIDIRAFGKGHEQFYEKVQKEGVVYRRGNVSEIYRQGDKLIVRAEDTLLREFFETEADLVVLATGLVPHQENQNLAKMLRLPLDADGFFLEAHPKLGPVETTTDGIVLAGCCQGPKDITDTIVQARAAAAKVSIPLFCGKLKREPLVPKIDAEVCMGCRICEPICEFGALVFDPRLKVMTINELLCRGCGSCSVICPSGANQVNNFSKKQILETVTALT
ncbi:4Fe-4S dicluster domain-containing protein [Chloroflexota bacterium]